MLLPSLLAVGFTGCLAAFQLALGKHFRHSQPLRAPMRALVFLSIAVWAGAMTHLMMRGAPPPAALAGAVLLLAGAALLFATTRLTTPPKVLPAAFAEDAPSHIIEVGPYRWVRHPFYLAYIIYWIGIVFAAPHPLIGAGVFAIVVSYVFLTRREERILLAGPLGEHYQRYFESTGRFLPRLTRRA